MITCHLMGGLGNQLFQIFTTIALAIENNVGYEFEYSLFLDKRHTYWDNFLIDIKKYTTVNNNIKYTIYPESGNFRYNKIRFNDYIKLYGYFQCFKYFEDYKLQLFELINLNKQICDLKEEYKLYINNDNITISMHFRIGDYINLPSYHPIQQIDYYIKALKYMLSQDIIENTNNKKIVVYYCCEHVNNDYVLINYINILKSIYSNYNITFIKIDDNIPDYKQLLLTSCCQYNIIANSSFSWWGAYFNNYKHKIVVYPSNWFGPSLSHLDTVDLCPEYWVRI